MKNSLLNLYNILKNKSRFSTNEPQAEGLVSNIQIKSNDVAVITLLTEEYPTPDILIQTEQVFEKLLNVTQVYFQIEPTNKDNIDFAKYLNWAARHIDKTDPFGAGLVRNSQLIYEDDIYLLNSTFSSDCSSLEKICLKLEKIFFKTFRIKIALKPYICELNPLSQSEDNLKIALDLAAKSMAIEAANPPINNNDNNNNYSNGNGYKGPRRKRKKTENTIFGHMNPDLPPVKMNELDNETGFTIFEGEVVSFESRNVSNGKKTLVKLNISDKTNTIKCYMFLDPLQATDFLENHGSSYLRIYADVGFDFKFEKDLVGKIIGIEKALPPSDKADNCEEKRVELHCHTKMSTKDAICDVEALIDRAVHYGHEAIAITDHGVAQAFPDARKTTLKWKKKGKNIKIIYGMEAYLSDDGDCAAYMCEDDIIKKGFVSFSGVFAEDDSSEKRVVAYSAVKYLKDETGSYSPSNVLKWNRSSTPLQGYDEEILGAMINLNAFIDECYIVSDNVLENIAPFRLEGFRTQKERDVTVKFFNGAIDTKKIKEKIFESDFSYKASIDDFPKNLFHKEIDDLDKIAVQSAKILILALERVPNDSLKALNLIVGQLDMDEFPANALGYYHSVILSTNEVGIYGLYRMISQSHIHGLYKARPRISRSVMKFFRTGNLYGGACEAGEVFMQACKLYDSNLKSMKKSIESLSDSDLLSIAKFYDYLEVMPIGNNEFMLREKEKRGNIIEARYSKKQDLENINKLIYETTLKANIPLCATCDVHFVNSEDSLLRNVLQSDMGYSDANSQPPLFYRTTAEMLDEFSYFGEQIAKKIVIDNTKKIAHMIKPDLKPFPEGSFPPSIDIAEKEVVDATWNVAKSLYEKNGELPEIVDKRIKKELKSIIGNGFAIMYYISMKLVKKSNDDGYIVGSRGSVGSSFVAKLCGITEVNPLPPHYLCSKCKYCLFDDSGEYGSGYDLPSISCPECGEALIKEGQDIPFETFLGFEGEKQPDIDLNFSGEYQPIAHKFIEDMFGSSHTFRAGTISGFAQMNTAMMVKNYVEANDIIMTGAEAQRLAGKLEGIKRTTGQHPGGIVVVPKEREIYDFTPIQCPADKVSGGVITTHFDFNSLHDTILKLDILGHDDPTMLKKLGDLTGVDVNTIDIIDEKILKLLKNADVLEFVEKPTHNCGTLGLPEMGTFLARDMMKETNPSRFYDIVQLMGLSHGKDVWNGNAQELIKDKTCTISDVIGCRDGIMTTLAHRGLPSKIAFEIMEDVRKGRGLTQEQEEAMVEHNVPRWYIESCRKIKYMFPKAHAVAYSISALRIAWFKIYRKAEYYCTYFTVRADNFDYRIMGGDIAKVRFYMKKFLPAFKIKEKITVPVNGKNEEFSTDKSKRMYYILELVEEMYCRGIKFLPLDIYKSSADEFIIEEENKIRPPLNTLPSVSYSVANNIVEARQKHPRFLSREDFAYKAGIGDSILELLGSQGCLDDLPHTTQIDIFSLCDLKEN